MFCRAFSLQFLMALRAESWHSSRFLHPILKHLEVKTDTVQTSWMILFSFIFYIGLWLTCILGVSPIVCSSWEHLTPSVFFQLCFRLYLRSKCSHLFCSCFSFISISAKYTIRIHLKYTLKSPILLYPAQYYILFQYQEFSLEMVKESGSINWS